MPRIPGDELERLKAEVSLERLAEARGVALQRLGADLIGLCPFHDDHKPSLVISPAKNLWHCLGACQRGGMVIDWVMQAENLGFRAAVARLREDYPGLVAAPAHAEVSTPRRLPLPLSAEAGNTTLLQQVIAFYHETLKQSPEALAYLQARGLQHPEILERFKLGYANRTLGARLPQNKGWSREQARACPPSSNRACGSPAHGFPMFFMPRHAPSASPPPQEPCTAHSARRDQHSGNDAGRSLCPSPDGASSSGFATGLPHGF